VTINNTTPARSSPAVLLVDDEPANLLALEALLEPLGATLVRAASGEQAVREAAETEFAAILLDVRMPCMDGLAAATLIRAQSRSANTPIIFVTASDCDEVNADAAYELGAVDFLTKPVRASALKAKVGFFIELQRHKEELRQSTDAAFIAERQRIGEALRASNERVRLATEASDLVLFTWEPQADRVIWENDRAYELFGLPRTGEPIAASRFVAEFVHPDDEAAFLEAANHVERGGDTFHFEGRFCRKPDRAQRHVEFRGRVQSADKGGPLRVVGTAADTTERKKSEEALRSGEERYRTLFACIDEGFCVIEMIYDALGRPVDYRFVEANPAFEGQTGLVDAVGRTVREMVPDHDQHWFEIYGEVVRNGQPVRFINEARALGRWFDTYASRVGGAGSAKVAVVFTDITARKKAEDRLRAVAAELVESDRRKTEFLATLAHELRNPMAPLRNGLHLLRMGGASPKVLQNTRDMMERQLTHMVRLIDDLLDVARISSGKVELKKERVALASIVSSAVETSQPLFDSAHHKFALDIPAEPLLLDADPTRLAQVLGNLLNNAAKYTPSGGHISLRAARDGADVLLSVQDTGVGIPAESMQQLFEMFAQVASASGRSQGGLGIGLSLVRALVELHGGTVTAASDGLGLGSTFSIRLPLAPEEAESARPADSEPAEAGSALRVLVVDDNADAADTLASILEMSGHETRVANDGIQALEVAQEFLPKVVFLDIGMPGPNGYEVAREMRKRPSTIDATLVALTGWGAADDLARSREAGFDHHLTKPADVSAIMALLSQEAGHSHRLAVSSASH
jgi:PAS domain S-box-containing protein